MLDERILQGRGDPPSKNIDSVNLEGSPLLAGNWLAVADPEEDHAREQDKTAY